jgi:anti-anti-sigma factor
MTDRRVADAARTDLLRVKTAIDGTVVSVAVIGELDIGSVGSLEEAVRRALELHHPTQVIIDLRRITFMDSTGLRLLLVLEAEARAEQWRLTIVRGPAAVQRTMELAGVGEQLKSVDDPADVPGDGPLAA